MSWLRCLLLLGAIAEYATAQFVPEPTDLTSAMGYAGVPVRYKAVPPGVCELNSSVKSFSGYADVEEDQHIFFWFFEAREVDPKEAPLTVWINGGPGSSSMLGLWQELGPCGVDFFGNVYDNPYSWSTYSNMLFIDQPTQVGFSYSVPIPATKRGGEVEALPNNTCPPDDAGKCGTWSRPSLKLTANSTDNAAPNMWKTLQGFMGAFPQYSREGFHFTCESYGGHYGPVFNEYFEKQNAADIPGAAKIKLESVMIGNGWFDPIIQYQAYYNFTVSPGNTYDYAPFNETIEEMMYENLYGKGKCVDGLKHCAATGDNDICSRADNYCAINVELLLDDYPSRDEYDIRETYVDPFPYSFFVDYLNTPELQKAIGAYTNFSTSSSAVGTAFSRTGDDGRRMRTIRDVRDLLDQGVTVAFYAGDADYNCNWLGGQAVAKAVGAPGWEKAGWTDVVTSDGLVNGQVKQAGKFSLTRVYYSGHEVPFYQPLLALEMMKRVIQGKDVATGCEVAEDSYRSKGPAESTFREGNSTVQWKKVSKKITYDVQTHEPGAPWKKVKGQTPAGK